MLNPVTLDRLYTPSNFVDCQNLFGSSCLPFLFEGGLNGAPCVLGCMRSLYCSTIIHKAQYVNTNKKYKHRCKVFKCPDTQGALGERLYLQGETHNKPLSLVITMHPPIDNAVKSLPTIPGHILMRGVTHSPCRIEVDYLEDPQQVRVSNRWCLELKHKQPPTRGLTQRDSNWQIYCCPLD